MPGPIPNREADLTRPRERRGKSAGKAAKTATRGVLKPVHRPAPDPEWGKVAKMAYKALLTSGMADFYQDSDWATAWIVLSELDVYRTKGPIMVKDDVTGKMVQATDADGNPMTYPTHRPSGQMFQAIMAALATLGMTEGERRRMKIELSEPVPDGPSASVTAIAAYQKELDED